MDAEAYSAKAEGDRQAVVQRITRYLAERKDEAPSEAGSRISLARKSCASSSSKASQIEAEVSSKMKKLRLQQLRRKQEQERAEEEEKRRQEEAKKRQEEEIERHEREIQRRRQLQDARMKPKLPRWRPDCGKNSVMNCKRKEGMILKVRYLIVIKLRVEISIS